MNERIREPQAEQEPVARHNIIGYQPINNSASVIAPPKNPNGKSEQSPVAIKQLPDPYDERDGVWFDAEGLQRLRELPVGSKLYAAPVRTKDLTDEEIEQVIDAVWNRDLSDIEFARAVIAADREKNK